MYWTPRIQYYTCIVYVDVDPSTSFAVLRLLHKYQPRLGTLDDVRMFRRAVRLAANRAGGVGGMPTTPVPTAHGEQRDRRVLVTAAGARRALASV